MSKKIMKRSLALGALMAFVITGSAFAEEINLALKGDTTVGEISSSSHSTYVGNAVLGGAQYELEADNETNNLGVDFKNFDETQIIIKDGAWDDVIGGNQSVKIKNDMNKDNPPVLSIRETNVIVNGGTVKRAIGGSRTDSVGYMKMNTETTNVYVGKGVTVEKEVIGGDYLKTNGLGYTGNNNYPKDTMNSSYVTNTHVVIDGATVNGHVFGGSVAELYYGHALQDIKLSVKNENTNLIIRDATINANIYGAGGAISEACSSTVDNVYMDISGGTYTKDIYSGGLLVDFNQDKGGLSYESDFHVGKAIVSISDATITNFYAHSAKIDGKSNDSYSFNGVGMPQITSGDNVSTDLTLTNVIAETVDVQEGSVTLSATADANAKTEITTLNVGDNVAVSMEASGETTDALNGDTEAFAKKISVGGYNKEIKGVMRAGDVIGEIEFTKDENGKVTAAPEKTNPYNDAIGEAAVALKSHWRAHMNDMNKRMGELRNANGEHGVWTRMVRGEAEYEGAKAQYNQYQLGYDEKLSVDKRWTVGAAVTFAEGDASYGYGSTEDDSTAFAIYGSKLNDDGTYVDLIARYARLESDLDDVKAGKGDYSTNGYSFSAEFGKRIEQGKGLWIEPQVELTYGSVDSAEFTFDNGKHVQVGDMDSFIGRVGFRIGKDVKQGNVYARASYLYDFDGETESTYSSSAIPDPRTIKEDLGGGWWEVGVGANINLSDATYIYADVEKTFGGEVDTNWQWNLGVRYSF